MNNMKIFSLTHPLRGTVFNLREKLTGYRREKRIFKKIKEFRFLTNKQKKKRKGKLAKWYV